MSESVLLTSDLLRWDIDRAAGEWARRRRDVLRLDFHPAHLLQRGAEGVVRLTLKRLVAGKPLPMKPTAAQARYGITADDVTELVKVTLAVIDDHVARMAEEMVRWAPQLSERADRTIREAYGEAAAPVGGDPDPFADLARPGS